MKKSVKTTLVLLAAVVIFSAGIALGVAINQAMSGGSVDTTSSGFVFQGESYESADAKCQTFVQGDVWSNVNHVAIAESAFNANGQLVLYFGNLIDGGPYYNGLIMSGRQVYWNRANAATTGLEGEFSEDCKMLTITRHPAKSIVTLYWHRHAAD